MFDALEVLVFQWILVIYKLTASNQTRYMIVGQLKISTELEMQGILETQKEFLFKSTFLLLTKFLEGN